MTVIVFLVAGMSSRFGGKPKPLTKVGPNNETLIEYSVNQAIKSGYKEIIFITNSKTEQSFKDLFGEKYKNIKVKYIQQTYNINNRSRPWGTTDAICNIIGHINDPFILVNGDDIYGEETFKQGYILMKERNINIIGGLKIIKTLPKTGLVNRGIISIDTESNTRVSGLKEMLNISYDNNPELLQELSNVNFIGLQVSVLDKLKVILDRFKKENVDDPKLECLLPDNLNELIQNNDLSMQFFEITSEIMGITNPGDEDIIREKLSKCA
jgi:UTP-glucose-1-phosphate uridylyltransferase